MPMASLAQMATWRTIGNQRNLIIYLMECYTSEFIPELRQIVKYETFHWVVGVPMFYNSIVLKTHSSEKNHSKFYFLIRNCDVLS